MPLIVGLDIETTGLKQEEGHRIIEIALLTYDLDTRKLVGSHVQRINPERPIDPKAQEVHGISFNELTGCPTWDTVGPKVLSIMAKADVCVAHNANFDAPFVGMELIRLGLDVPDVPFFDTLKSRWATPFGKNPKLSELCFALDVPYDPSAAHGAEYDTSIMMQCLFAGVDLGFFDLKPYLKEMKEAA